MSKNQFNRLKIVLVEKNITSKELAAGLDKTESTISRWCTNQAQPSVETLFEIAHFLKVNVRDLLVSTESKG